MPILTYSRRSQENEPQAKALLEEGDGHLAEGNNDKALDCYIRAADISYSITAEYAHKAAKIALDYKGIPGFEGDRIAGCFYGLAYDADNQDETLEQMFCSFEVVLDCWKRHNIKPQQHLICSGEGGKVYLLELQWNEGGDLHESARDTGVVERIMDHINQKPLYAVSLDTLLGWRPFSITPVANNDEELLRILPAFARGGISYVSSRLRPLVVELIGRGGNACRLSEFPEFPEIPASMNWYENYGYLGDGFGKLEGVPDQ